ncbi:MAG: hypothetical protein HOV80_33430 [Polyangiaceae bacterium]|nr:hypothetical protein [Polyangiaceae bacterium]
MRRSALALVLLFTPAVALAQDRTPDTDLPSCERAVADYVEDRTTGPEPQRDLGSSEYGEVLNNGTFLNRCGVPDSTKVVVCVAVQNGKAVGATVTTEPSSDDINRCVRNEVAVLEYPSHPKMDLAKTTFAPADEDHKRGDASRPSPGDVQAEPPPAVAPKKSGCGCALPGFEDERAPASVALALGALVFLRRRRR